MFFHVFPMVFRVWKCLLYDLPVASLGLVDSASLHHGPGAPGGHRIRADSKALQREVRKENHRKNTGKFVSPCIPLDFWDMF